MFRLLQEQFNPTEMPLLVVSFHDLHPGNYRLCDWFLRELSARGVHRATLLAVPFWHKKQLANQRVRNLHRPGESCQMKPNDCNLIGRWWKYCAVSLFLGLGVLGFILARSIDQKMLEALRSLPIRNIGVLGLLVAGAWTSHGLRYWILTRALKHPLAFGDSIRIASSIEFAVAATPSGSGGALARFAFFTSRGIPLYLSTSIFAVNVCMDMCVSILLTTIAFSVIFFNERWQGLLNWGSFTNPATAYKVAGTVVLVALLMVFLLQTGRRLFGRRLSSGSRGSLRIMRRIRYSFHRLRRFLRTSWKTTRHIFAHHRGAVIADFLLAISQWGCRYGILPALIIMFGKDINPLPLFALQGLFFISGLLMVLPGGGGGLEILSALILPAFVAAEYVAIVVLLWRFFTYYLHLLAGGAIFAFTFPTLKVDRGMRSPG